MLCSRGRKRKSFEMEDERENLIVLENGDYICMSGLKKAAKRSQKCIESQPFSRDCPQRSDDFYEEFYQEKKISYKESLKGRGQLQLAIYANCGLLTIHVIQASHLSKAKEEGCCAFVKVSLIPDHCKRTKCRTNTTMRSRNPVFDEKFSFELLEEDLRKRILISVWHRERADEHSECLGCMSFGIQHILSQKKTVDGWYYILTEDIGKRKHLQVACHPQFSSPTRTNHPHTHIHHGPVLPNHPIHPPCSPIPADPKLVTPLRGEHGIYTPIHVIRADQRVSSTPRWEQGVSSTPRWEEETQHTYQTVTPPKRKDKEPVYVEIRQTPTPSACQDIVTLESHVFVIKRGSYGYGFRVSGAGPVKVSRVDHDTPAESVGLQKEDLIVRLNGANVAKATCDSVARIIKASQKKIIMEVERPVQSLPLGKCDTPQFTEKHPLIETPEYTPLIFKNKGKGGGKRSTRSPSPTGRIGRDREKEERTRTRTRTVGMCAPLPTARKVRFHDEDTR